MTENVIHAHEFLNVLADHPQGCSLDEVRTIITERYGPQVTFYNCQDRRFTLDELYQFMQSKGKIQVTGDQVSLGQYHECGA
jgi:probable metal-binding protein